MKSQAAYRLTAADSVAALVCGIDKEYHFSYNYIVCNKSTPYHTLEGGIIEWQKSELVKMKR